MTGLQLKEFAARVHVEAEIQIEATTSYRSGWEPLEAKNIRAVHTVVPEEDIVARPKKIELASPDV